MVIVRFADDFVCGFEHQGDGDAKQFLHELRKRFADFGLQLQPEKTRLIEFGRYAAHNRKARGLGKPETFDFLWLHPYLWEGPGREVPPPAHHGLEEDAGEAESGQ